MAGIGFELQRVIKGEGLRGAVKAAFAGIMIAAGPWILSIVGIFLIYKVSFKALSEGSSLFNGVIVYSYAFSLSIFGGFHYIFTRYIADLIFLKKDKKAFGALIMAIVLVSFLAGIMALVTIESLKLPGLSHPLLFKISGVLLFVSINLIWLVMIYITLLKKYAAISLIYLGGMVLAIGASWFLGTKYLLGGALAGFCTGQVFILISLFLLIFISFKPSSPMAELLPFLKYFRKYIFLFLTGIFYSTGIWIDKIILWFTIGKSVQGTGIRLFGPYDMPVYLANLTIIPGLVYFMIFSETNFFTALKRFLLHLGAGNYTEITSSKYFVLKSAKKSLFDQALFQGLITFVLVAAAYDIKELVMGNVSTVATFRIILAALFFNQLFLAVMTFLFYIEKYRSTLFISAVFFLVNAGGTLYGVATNLPYYGIGYLGAGVTGVIAGYIILIKGLASFDRNIFSRF